MKIKNICLIGWMACLGCLPAAAHDFTATVNGQRIYFNITDKVNRTAEVTFKGSIADNPVCEAKGEIEIPASVRHHDAVYSITAIGPKAFSGAGELTGVILPPTVTRIGDFAFEGCPRLGKVVFPGGGVTLGQGTFFKCTALRDLSFGSDWKSIDFAPYRWSDSLRAVSIPAKVTKVQNLKSLRALRRVEVDANNARFSAADGVLYSKDGKTLYGVPRAYKGVLKIRGGVETVTRGSLVDCVGLTVIVFPATLKNLPFRETSRMTSLTEVIFKSTEPLLTATASGRSYFLLQVANPDVTVVVPKEAKKAYVKQWAVDPGEYTEIPAQGNIPYQVSAQQLPAAKNIRGVKNFDKYE